MSELRWWKKCPNLLNLRLQSWLIRVMSTRVIIYFVLPLVTIMDTPLVGVSNKRWEIQILTQVTGTPRVSIRHSNHLNAVGELEKALHALPKSRCLGDDGSSPMHFPI